MLWGGGGDLGALWDSLSCPWRERVTTCAARSLFPLSSVQINGNTRGPGGRGRGFDSRSGLACGGPLWVVLVL